MIPMGKMNLLHRLMRKTDANLSVKKTCGVQRPCRVESTPPTLVRGPSGGPVMVSAGRDYCVTV